MENDAPINYERAKKTYTAYGVDIDRALKRLATVPVSLPCWQGDDVGGFGLKKLDGGLVATGNYPGKARDWDELKADLAKAISLIPGRRRVNVHAIYANSGAKTDRDQLSADNFRGWIDWAKEMKIGLDFNGTFFAHPHAASGRTLSHPDKKIRDFWIEHGRRAREIGAAIGKELKSPCVVNLWIPDGSKDLPYDRFMPRKILMESLDAVFAKQFATAYLKDSVESKLFGIGSEACVVGSHEFYLGYALRNNIMLCLDMGHFHPTESVADKISALLLYSKELLLHVSRGLRWDSDHVAVLNDEIRAVAEEIVRGDVLGRVNFALDYFDASINRIAAWVIGARALLKAILIALLEPGDMLREAELKGNNAKRLALMEMAKTLPFGAVWDKFCLDAGAPPEHAYFDEIITYEEKVLAKRR